MRQANTGADFHGRRKVHAEDLQYHESWPADHAAMSVPEQSFLQVGRIVINGQDRHPTSLADLNRGAAFDCQGQPTNLLTTECATSPPFLVSMERPAHSAA
jgi:hypothetical protein